MKIVARSLVAHAATASCAIALALTLSLGAAAAQGKTSTKTYTMKITLPTLNDPSYFFAKAYAAALEKDTGNRIKPQIFPLSQLGSIPRQIEGTQFGSIQCAIIPPEFFVGVDDRFEVLSAPGLVGSLDQGQHVAADPAVRKLILGLGANKGLHGVAVFMNAPSSVIAKSPIRHLADFKGKKIRVLASPFQTVPISRLGATPVAMTLADVVPALQQGTIDGAVGGIVVWTPMHFNDAAKYVTETGQPAVFVVVEINKAWYDSLPADLRKIVDDDAAAGQKAIAPTVSEIVDKARKGWTAGGGELISLPANEQSEMMKMFSDAVTDVVKNKPAVGAAYDIVKAAAQRAQ
ncbi:MAG: TRAP transporter substrate-binding protein [Xanthobacteraceae bacterium]